MLFRNMVDLQREKHMKSRRLLTATGATLIIAPWLYALAALKANPQAGNDGGVMELATYISVVTAPLGFVLLVTAFMLKRQH